MRRRSAALQELGSLRAWRTLVHFGVVRDEVFKVHELTREPRCCRDPTGGTRGPDRGSRAALRLTRDARLALQAEPGPTPPHPGAEAQGHELARLRREPAPAWQLDGLVF